MYLYLVAGALCAGIAVAAALNAAHARRRAAVARVVAAVDQGGFVRLPGAAQSGALAKLTPHESPLSALITRLGGLFSGRLTAVREGAIREQLIAAGMYTTSPRMVLGYRVISTVTLPALVLLVARTLTPEHVFIALLALFAGWILPLTIVQRKARKRIEQLDRTLPDLIDLLCVMIEAGLSFPAALRLSAEQFGRPLSDELRLTLQEQSMGLAVDEALGHLAQRANTPAMKSFVRAMSQGEKMGISTGQIMRDLSHEMRNRRRAKAEERAQKTPVLILFPLVFLIFPAMFVILMAPAAISMLHSLSHV